MRNLEGKIALVTGASRGIGQAIATQFAKQGAMVIGTATTEKSAQAISAYFENQGLSGQGYCLDVTKEGDINTVVTSVKEQVGVINILVNNAAITRDNLLLRMDDDEWSSVINTNLSAVFHMTKACLKDMFRARWGRIINISSIVGYSGNPGQANYCAAKAGVVGMSKSLAQEIASRGVTVNVVAPGFIDTDMTRELPDAQRDYLLKAIPMKRMGEPNDIASAVAFLASDNASYITGQTIHVNGGMLMV